MGGKTLQRGEVLEGWGRVGEHLATGHFTSFHRVDGSPRGALVAEALVEDFAKDERVVQLFHGEAARWSSVRHAALAAPLGSGKSSSGAPFVLTEAIDGIPLTAYIAQSQRFPPDLVAAMLQQLLEALTPIHRLGMAHGAITTTRVALVRRASGSFSARLRGFGRRSLASLVSRDAFDALTRLDAIAFASPDVARGGAIDDDADRWSLAVLAHELLTGRAPFGGPTPFARYQALVRQSQAPSLTLPPDAHAFAEFFAVAFAPQRKLRFASSDAMLEALLRAVTPRSVATMGDLAPSIDAPLVAPPVAPSSTPALEAATHAAAKPRHDAGAATIPPRASLDSTLASDAPQEEIAAVRAAIHAATAPRHGGTLRSAIDPAVVIAASKKSGGFRAILAPWRETRFALAFAFGLVCGVFLGVLLAHLVTR